MIGFVLGALCCPLSEAHCGFNFLYQRLITQGGNAYSSNFTMSSPVVLLSLLTLSLANLARCQVFVPHPLPSTVPSGPLSTASTASGALLTQPPSLQKRAGEICASLASPYPGVVAPSCSGTLSKCKYVGLMQGCCDDASNCQFHTTCYDHDEAATMTADCGDSMCLSWLVLRFPFRILSKRYLWKKKPSNK